MEEIKNKNKKMVIIVTILVVFIGITFAYIIAQISGGAIGNANVTADTTDNLQFNIDKDITLNPNQFNVVEGGGGHSDTATGTASLLANSTNKSATFDYYVYFQINTNEYIYTTEDQKPEIVLSITDPTDQPVTSVDGLKYVTAQNADGTTVSGFDITTQSGLFNIASNYEITSSSSTQATEQDWIFTVTFINLTTNQAANGGSTLDAEIILSKDKRYTLAGFIQSQYTTDGENGLYYHDGTGTYGTLEAGDNSYRYAGGDYQIAEAYTGTYSKIYDEIILLTCDGESQLISDFNCNSDNFYFTLAYDTNKTQYTTMKSALEKATADGYLTKDNIKNYVCFGTDAETCPSDNLYRVLGVYNGQVKLVKADYATSSQLGENGDYYGTHTLGYYYSPMYTGDQTSGLSFYYWNNVNYDVAGEATGYANVWSYSELNTVNLNTNYWNSINPTWQEKIDESTWYVGGIPYADVGRNTAKSIYEAELGDGKVTTAPFEPYNAKIGLMYVSEYLYSANPEYWGTINYDTVNPSGTLTENWLVIGVYDWTISRSSDVAYLAFYVRGGFDVGNDRGVSSFGGVRPSFSLKSSVVLTGGSGSSADPYRIA